MNALKAKITKELKKTTQDDIDELVRGFLMVRTIPREKADEGLQVINAFNTLLMTLGLVRGYQL